MTHPMYFDDEPQEGFVEDHAAYLGIGLIPGEIENRNAVEQVGMDCRCHLLLVPFPLEYALYRIPVSPDRHSRASGNLELKVTFQYRQDHLETVLDPDTGVWSGQRQPKGGWDKHLRVPEVARIASAPGRENLLTLVFDQSYTRTNQDSRSQLAQKKLKALRDHHTQCQHQPACPVPLHGAAYVTHAVFIWVSQDRALVEGATRQMLGQTHLPDWRVVRTPPANHGQAAQ